MLCDHAPAGRGKKPSSPPRRRSSLDAFFAHAADAPLGHAAHELRGRCDAPAAAWPPATGAVPADSQVPGKSVGSTAVPGSAGRSPGASIPSAPDVRPWRKHSRLSYARRVPREVTAPLGQPGEDSLSPPRALPPVLSDPTNTHLARSRHLPLRGYRRRSLLSPAPLRRRHGKKNSSNLRAALPEVKEDRRKQGRRRFRCARAWKDTTKETIRIDRLKGQARKKTEENSLRLCVPCGSDHRAARADLRPTAGTHDERSTQTASRTIQVHDEGNCLDLRAGRKETSVKHAASPSGMATQGSRTMEGNVEGDGLDFRTPEGDKEGPSGTLEPAENARVFSAGPTVRWFLH